jgi:hypothetical protein
MTGEKVPNGKWHGCRQYNSIFGIEKKFTRREFRRYQKKILSKEFELSMTELGELPK